MNAQQRAQLLGVVTDVTLEQALWERQHTCSGDPTKQGRCAACKRREAVAAKYSAIKTAQLRTGKTPAYTPRAWTNWRSVRHYVQTACGGYPYRRDQQLLDWLDRISDASKGTS
jgi:hypothetical protein